MIFKKLRWTLKRHPFLYTTRFRLLSKNSNVDKIESISYNSWNPKTDIPDYFYEINDIIFASGKPNSDFELIKHLTTWLCLNARVGSGLSEPSDKALKSMLYGSGGVCSDLAQVFNNFCVINDILVREWGTTSAPFNPENGGHSFNEVYVNEFEQWILIDPSWGGYFVNSSKKPLSVLNLYNELRAGNFVSYKTFVTGKHVSEDQILKNYLNPDVTPFLICKYVNKIYDRYLALAKPYVPVFTIHFLLYLLGKSYYYVFPLDDFKKIFFFFLCKTFFL